MLLAHCKSKKLSSKSTKKMASYLESHVVPAVVGPGLGLYITDHHHLVYSLYQSGMRPNSIFPLGGGRLELRFLLAVSNMVACCAGLYSAPNYSCFCMPAA